MKIYIQTNKAKTNIFDFHTQPRKTTRYTNILKFVWGGGEKEKEPKWLVKKSKFVWRKNPPRAQIFRYFCNESRNKNLKFGKKVENSFDIHASQIFHCKVTR